ncbi:DUF6153 family protein [Streptomyces sp. NPDC051064]|uniref:DUF6153 family protein n=1 Tax=Streptomyces sp. NPDC051064 TaxID=3365641 RepID=UPI00378FAFBD
MPRHELLTVPRPRLLQRGLLVLGLLIGLLGMHGLGWVPAAAQMNPHSLGNEAAHVVAVIDLPEECGRDSGGGSGHPEHADATCSSGAVAGSPVLPAPLPSTIGDVPRGQEMATAPCGSTEGSRAPPSLAELQLLRI